MNCKQKPIQPGCAIPREYAHARAPAAYALREAKDRGRPFSINRKVGAYTKEIFKGVF
jgi:hypothetical protein